MTLNHSNNHIQNNKTQPPQLSNNPNATVADASFSVVDKRSAKELLPAIPTDSSQNVGKVSGGTTPKTATILVSKTKTKTGLPLLMKNANNLV